MYEEIFKLHADLLKAIAHPRRLEILHLLRDQTLVVSQIVEMLDLPQANISQHLAILRQAGVVKTSKNGKTITYAIAHPNFLIASDAIRQVLAEKHQEDKAESILSSSMLELIPVVHDPVCKMRVSPKTAGAAITYKHIDYYFCATGCKKKFLENPAAYLQKE